MCIYVHINMITIADDLTNFNEVNNNFFNHSVFPFTFPLVYKMSFIHN